MVEFGRFGIFADARSRAERLPKRPRIFFEEWDDPLICGIGWVSELVEIAGGIDILADRAGHAPAKDRLVTIDKVVAREPDLIIGSWCGEKFRPERVMLRPGFERTPAVQHQDLYGIKSPPDLAARSRCADRRPRAASENYRTVEGQSNLDSSSATTP
jgi:iron complex transport system substrate-binding protein